MNEKNIPELNFIEIGNRIKMLRGVMQQVDFATIFDLKQQDISKIETAKIKPSSELLLKIGVHFNKSIEWLLTGRDKIPESQASGVSDNNSIYQTKINIADLKAKTEIVLRSNTVYSTVLKDIIVAYYEATIYQEELAEKQKALAGLPAAKDGSL